MMTKIVTLLTEGFADWETALLNAAGRTYYKLDTAFASPGGKPVTSSGGMRVLPGLDIDTLALDDVDALIVCGGTAWQGANPPDIAALLHKARDKNMLIGLICDGTVAGAHAGLLDDIDHTSNGAGYLDVTGYKGKPHYKDTAEAVTARRIVTAAGTSPVSFMRAVLAELGLADGNLDYYIGLHRAQFGKAA